MNLNIYELLKMDENKHLEFKERIVDARSISKLAIAFANSGGGTIVFGVKNKSKKIIGVNAPILAEEKIANIIADNCTPTIIPDIYITTINDKSLLIVNIPRGMLTPYYLRFKSKENSTYIKVGSTTKLADEHTIRYLELLKLNMSFDELPDNRFSINDLDIELIKNISI